jgi:general secretion pathway protein I
MEEWIHTKKLVQCSSPQVLQSSNTPWPRPDVQGLSSMASFFELLKRYKIVPDNSRQGGPLLQSSRSYLGFTLLEVMIAVTIIAIVLVAVFGSQSQSLSLANDAKFNTTAALLAQRKMAEVEIGNSLDLSSTSGDFGEDFPEYQWELNVSDVPLPGTGEMEYLKQVDLIIRWGNEDRFQYGLRLYRFVPRAK